MGIWTVKLGWHVTHPEWYSFWGLHPQTPDSDWEETSMG